MFEAASPADSSAFSLVFEGLLLGMLVWVVLSMLVAASAFPRFIARENQVPRDLGAVLLGRPSRRDPQRAYQRIEPVRHLGLSSAALKRALVLEMHRPLLEIRYFIGRALLYVLSLVPVLTLGLNGKIRSLTASQADWGVIALLLLAALVPPLVFLAFMILADGSVNRLWPLEMLVWTQFCDLLAAEASPERWWRWPASRRARRLSRLIEVLELDLLDYRGVRKDERRVVPRAMEIVASFEKCSDRSASNPAGQLDTRMVSAALDAWICGNWDSLPSTEPTPAILASRSARSSRVRKRVTIGLSALALAGIAVGGYFAFGRTQSAAVLGSTVSLVAGALLGSLKAAMDRRLDNGG